MHPRLRRQLAMLRTDLPPAFRQLISAIDRVYREADTERAELEELPPSVISLPPPAQSPARRRRRRQQEPAEEAGEAERRLRPGAGEKRAGALRVDRGSRRAR